MTRYDRRNPLDIIESCINCCIANSKNIRDKHMDAAMILTSVRAYLRTGQTRGCEHPAKSTVAQFFGPDEYESALKLLQDRWVDVVNNGNEDAKAYLAAILLLRAQLRLLGIHVQYTESSADSLIRLLEESEKE